MDSDINKKKAAFRLQANLILIRFIFQILFLAKVALDIT